MTIHRLSTLAALFLLSACLLPSPALAQDFQGTFSGQGVMMTLQPAQDGYYGTLIFDDEFYSIKAGEEDGELSGSFVTARGEFDFKASFRSGALALETNSITYLLYRAGQEPPEAQDPEPAADAEAEPAAPAVIAEAAATPEAPAVDDFAAPADDEPTSGGVLASMDFEGGVLPDRAKASKSVAADESKEAPSEPAETDRQEPETADAGSADAGPEVAGSADEPAEGVTAELVGTWQREPAGDGTLLAGATEVELGADGGFSAAGASGGSWKAEAQVLFLRTSDAGEWQPYCRYSVAGDSLLCTVDDDTRELWFRR